MLKRILKEEKKIERGITCSAFTMNCFVYMHCYRRLPGVSLIDNSLSEGLTQVSFTLIQC